MFYKKYNLYFQILLIIFNLNFTKSLNSRQRYEFFKSNNNDYLIVSDKVLEFNKLENLNDIKRSNPLSKRDPFEVVKNFPNKDKIKSIKILGLISGGSRKFAIIKYEQNIGKVAVGEIGGKTTKLLPSEFKLISINLKESKIIVELNNVQYTILKS